MLHDEAEISVRSGNGGPGAVSFRREKFVPEGGPDGGDGGDGGDVILRANGHLNTLTRTRKRKNKAKNGLPGEGRQCFEKTDLVPEVPLGLLSATRRVVKNSLT